jgi:hypothetical protein
MVRSVPSPEWLSANRKVAEPALGDALQNALKAVDQMIAAARDGLRKMVRLCLRPFAGVQIEIRSQSATRRPYETLKAVHVDQMICCI